MGIVGRDAELERLVLALEDVERGASPILAVTGQPGIGKSCVLSDLAGRARRRGHLVLTGRAAELERDLPFGLFVDAADDYLVSLDEALRPKLGPERLRELAVVFPAFSDAAGATVQAERYRSYRAVRRLLEGLAAGRPMVLVLDDVQWADAASVELMCHLLRSPPQGSVLLALGFRPSQVPASLAAGVEAAVRQGQAEVVDLAPLTSLQCEQLLDGLAPPVRAEVYRQGGGVPFYVLELARAAVRSTDAVLGELPELGIPVPDAVRTALGAEIGALEPLDRRLLEGAAAVGDPFELGLALTASELGRSDAMPALDRLVRRQLLTPADIPSRFRFRHPLVRRAVYELTGAGWRLGAHARVAAALRQSGVPPEAMAHHVERFAGVGDMEAIGLLAAAGRSARVPASAVRWFRAALRLLDQSCDRDRELELKGALAMALGLTGRLDEAHALLCEILDALPDTAVTMRTRLTAFCANVEHHLGRMDDAHRRLVEALEDVPGRRSPEAVLLMMELCFSFVMLGQGPERARSTALDALAVAVELGDRPLAAAAAAHCVFAAGTGPYPPEPSGRVDGWARLTDDLTDTELARDLNGPLKLGQGELFLDRFDDAARHLQRGIDVARATGQGQTVWIMLVVQVLALVPVGRLAEATEAADHALETSRLSGSPEQMRWSLAAGCVAATAAGSLQSALALESELQRLGPPNARRPFLALVGWAFPEAVLLAGDAERAYRMIVEALEEGDIPGLLPSARVRAREVATRIALAAGRRSDAAAWALSAEALAGDTGLEVPAALAHRATAAVAMAEGDHERGAERAMVSAAAADRVGATFEAARSRLLAGAALARSGQKEKAIAILRTAENEFALFGAATYRAQAIGELRRLGRRTGPHRQGGPDRLSAREREVAELAATGTSSREIAARLFVSQKTVESHLAHVFAKLGISSRRAIGPALLEENGHPAAPGRWRTGV
jgi:DNA-binding CsgD family transcriptional regulator